jgi:hypothetical protein
MQAHIYNPACRCQRAECNSCLYQNIEAFQRELVLCLAADGMEKRLASGKVWPQQEVGQA